MDIYRQLDKVKLLSKEFKILFSESDFRIPEFWSVVAITYKKRCPICKGKGIIGSVVCGFCKGTGKMEYKLGNQKDVKNIQKEPTNKEDLDIIPDGLILSSKGVIIHTSFGNVYKIKSSKPPIEGEIDVEKRQ